MRKNRIIKLIVAAVTVAATVIIDQLTKKAVLANMAVGEQIDVIKNVLRWTFVKNEGAAFGSLADARWVFLVASSILIVAIIAYMIFGKNLSWFCFTALSLILGGGIGNMIDRIGYGYVVDFVDFYLIPFWHWVFNVADACVCVGGALLVISLLFEKKGSESNG